jgi:hypothetical protein
MSWGTVILGAVLRLASSVRSFVHSKLMSHALNKTNQETEFA